MPLPKKEHDKLVRQAKKKGLTGDRAASYVHSTLRKIATARKKRKR